jgi:hypothetical protein
MSVLKRIAMALALAAPGSAIAATDGTLGATSTGTFDATLTITAPVSNITIIGMDDIYLGTVIRLPGEALNYITGLDDFCMNYGGYAEDGSGFPGLMTMQVTQVGGGVNGEYALKGPVGSGKFVPVTLKFVGGLIGAELRPGGESRVDGAIFTVSPTRDTCNASSNALTFDSARVTVSADTIPADSDMADGALRALFAVIVSPPG